jgi:hypothetical protein
MDALVFLQFFDDVGCAGMKMLQDIILLLVALLLIVSSTQHDVFPSLTTFNPHRMGLMGYSSHQHLQHNDTISEALFLLKKHHFKKKLFFEKNWRNIEKEVHSHTPSEVMTLCSLSSTIHIDRPL